MRSGVLLAEEAPVSLMERCGCTDLEEAFLMLSHKQEQDTKTMVSLQNSLSTTSCKIYLYARPNCSNKKFLKEKKRLLILPR